MEIPIILVITHNGDDESKQFLLNWSLVLEKLRLLFHFRYMHIDIPKYKETLNYAKQLCSILKENFYPHHYPPQLINWIKWTPMLIVFTGLSWKMALNPNYSKYIGIPNGYILNGYFDYQQNRAYIRNKNYDMFDSCISFLANSTDIYFPPMQYFNNIKKEILDIYQSFTLSPFWTRSESGLFSSEPPKFI